MTDGTPAAAPAISVVICTRDRARLLADALGSLAAQAFPQDRFEVLVVDNASTDDTAAVARAFADRAPVRCLREDRVGLCIARNTGWRAARGRIVAYLDDDAVARPGWLAAIERAFAGPEAGRIGVAGGPAAPIWLAPRPPWLPEAIEGSLTIVDWGAARKRLDDLDQEWLVGANMAIPRRVLEDVGGFHPWLDRVGRNLLSSGDVHLQKRIAARGLDCVYVPEMAVGHVVPATRLKRSWFLRRFYWQGVSDAVMLLIDRSPSPAERLRVAGARAVALLRNRRRLGALVSRADAADGFARRCFALIDLGFIAGLLGAAGR